MFLIRLYLAPRASPIDSAVLLHYLDTTTTLLESSDMSVLGQGSDVSRTCRELCRVVQIPLPGTVINKISDGGQNRSVPIMSDLIHYLLMSPKDQPIQAISARLTSFPTRTYSAKA